MQDCISLDQIGNSTIASFYHYIEFFMIEKIVDYINNKKNDSTQGLRFKHNQDIEVKIRVFVVLEVILKEIRKSFLSFLVVDVTK